MSGLNGRWSRRQFVRGAGATGLGLLAGCQPPWSRPFRTARTSTLGFLVPGIPPRPRVRIMVVIDPLTEQHQRRILDFAAESRLPAIYEEREWVVAGGLMAYGPSIGDQYRRAAGYVVRILQGAQPAALPIDQAMTFDFAINLEMAQVLELTLPQDVLLQATEIIQ